MFATLFGFKTTSAGLERFKGLFDEEKLKASFKELGHDYVCVYGEAYGGAIQHMSKTYGNDLRFVAFDVQFMGQNVNGTDREIWLDVPDAEEVCEKLGIEFVHYKLVPATVAALDAERDSDSVQAIRNGIGQGKIREGIVLRPINELVLKNGKRMISKYKRAEFSETKTAKPVDEKRVAEKIGAIAEADDWVTETRLDN
ncbi:MAG: RNA ligase family protein, partial [Candidatus Shapirobacteria bacterium]